METIPFVQEINALLQADDLISLGREAQEIKTKFDDFLLEEERKDQVNALNAIEEGSTYEPQDFTPLKESFYAVYEAFKKKRNEQKTLRDALEKENLRLKKSLIQRLQEVVENEENIGAAYNAQKEIHETWKKVGDIPRDKRDEVQRDYSRMLEIFFHNMKIYRELKDHDYHRNTQLKLALINQLENLKNSANIRDMESALKTLQNEWEEIGPVQNEEWEKLKSSYWDAVRAVYEKINQHYNERRNTQLDNLEKKKGFILKLQEVNSDLESLNQSKLWDQATQKVLKLQEEWKTIGQAPRKENDEVWKDFRAQCDVFFTAKKAFNKSIEEQQKIVVEKKRELIDKAKEIQDSTDWKSTSEKLIRLQKEWKLAGNAGQKFENKLWIEFRAVCDVFFNARENSMKEQQTELESNFNAKKELIERIASFEASEDKVENLRALKEFSDTFKSIGHVPADKRDEVNQEFKKAIDNQYDKLQIDSAEKELILFKAKFDSVLEGSDRSNLIQREKSLIRKQIDQLNAEAIQMETNLSFFARSKGADSLRKEVDQKIAVIQTKIDGLKRKLKSIPNE